MKYLVMLGDGMADLPIPSFDGKTPLEAAHKPTMDYLASHGRGGTVKTVPDSMVPESDTANLAVLGYDPRVYSKGRSPLEAMSIGLDMQPDDFAFRVNLVTVSDDEPYENKTMLDHSSGEITTEEARELISALDAHFGNTSRHIYTGVSYRHCMIWKNPPGAELSEKIYDFSRPHDILGQKISRYIPSGETGGEYGRMYPESYELLKDHPVNKRRIEKGLNPANSIWIWSPGKKPALPRFDQRYGLKGTVVSAVDLIKGIGICAGLKAPDVPGATGTVDTNYAGKAACAIKAFESGDDYVYIHVEGPDECGHRAELENKIRAIENIDSQILAPVKAYLENSGEPYRILLMPDHPTPISLRTHTREPVPFVIFDSTVKTDTGITCFSEQSMRSGVYIPDGFSLSDIFIQK